MQNSFFHPFFAPRNIWLQAASPAEIHSWRISMNRRKAIKSSFFSLDIDKYRSPNGQPPNFDNAENYFSSSVHSFLNNYKIVHGLSDKWRMAAVIEWRLFPESVWLSAAFLTILKTVSYFNKWSAGSCCFADPYTFGGDLNIVATEKYLEKFTINWNPSKFVLKETK